MMAAISDVHVINAILLAAKYPTLKRVGVFGSYARGEASENSDIDLVYDYDETSEQSTDELLGYVEEINDLLISCACVTKVDYVWFKGAMESSDLEFQDALLRDVIWIYDCESN